ncbi:MAG: hypothetical protein EXS38_06545 [Opitutus sp.]|nr:hypothetical protein [Opitutus sp.]
MNAAALIQRRIVGAAGLAAVALFLGLIARYYHPVYGFTALIQVAAVSEKSKIPEFREQPIYVHPGTDRYDGYSYAQIAYHPALDAPELHRAIDNLSMRARRMLPATAAWLLAAGQKPWIARVYAMLNIAAWLTLAALLWRILAVTNTRGWLAWAGLMFSAGALASVRLALTDLIALLFIAAAMAAAESGRNRRSTVALAAAGLTRETALLAVVGAWERPWFSRRNWRLTLGAWAPLALWMLYVLWRVGPANQGLANLALPVTGFVEKWIETLYALGLYADWPLTWSTLLCTLGLTVQGAFFLLRRDVDSRWWRLGAAYTGLMLCLGTEVWEDFPGAAARVLLPMTLAFNVLAHRRRAPLAWLLLGNLTVFAGFVALRDPPAHPRQMAALNSGGVAGIAEFGEGWYGRERHGRHTWFWTARRGTIGLETWPKSPTTIELQFRLRALAPGTVVIRQAGRELTRITAGTALSDHALKVRVEDGRAEIEFATDLPPTRENANPDARQLAFALYDPRIALSEP